jgi:hypothetical protein
METGKEKKGLLATIWESMTKTGGCCGGGKSCCGPANEDDKKCVENKQGAEPEN